MSLMINKGGDIVSPSSILLTVAVVDSRSKTYPEYVNECLSSIEPQINNTTNDMLVVDNSDRLYTAGRMFNFALNNAKGSWVLFVGDDDRISPDYVGFIEQFISQVRENNDIVAVTTGTTFFDDKTGTSSIKKSSPMGAWRRDYFLEHPFDEFLNKYVDTKAVERFTKDGKIMVTCPWHFGYYYRSHDNQMSGKKKV